LTQIDKIVTLNEKLIFSSHFWID